MTRLASQRPVQVTLSRRALLISVPALPAVLAAAPPAHAPKPTQESLAAPDGRPIPLWVWHPAGVARGAIAFSHGALSAPWYYPDMIGAWVTAGYQVLAPLHIDSTEHPHHRDYASRDSWKARIEDMQAVSRRIAGRYIAAGHSYGALTALVLGGVSARVPEGINPPLRDPAAVCSVAFSPPPPIPSLIPAAGYGTLAVPALIETGTRDTPPGASGAESWRDHLVAYQAAAPGGHRYGLILDGVDHYFGGLICNPAKVGPPQRPQLEAAIACSQLFMSAWGLQPSASDQARLDARIGHHGVALLETK